MLLCAEILQYVKPEDVIVTDISSNPTVYTIVQAKVNLYDIDRGEYITMRTSASINTRDLAKDIFRNSP